MRINTFKYPIACCILLLLAIWGVNEGICQTVIVPPGATWKYLDDGSDQGTAWREVEFNDINWEFGPAQLGYGDGDEVTVVDFGPNPNNKYITTYFRHGFTVEDPAQYVGMLLKLLRDDGAIVYLNGVEIERSNMPSGNITYLTLASSTVGGSEEDMFFESYEDIGNLRQGTNILAVEIHQRSVTSSDISFDLELDGTTEHQDITRKAPYLIYTGNNTEMKIIWQLISSSTGILAWGLDTTYTMGRVQTSEYGDDHQHTYTITQLNPATKYFFQVTADEEIHRGSFYTAPPNDATEVKFFAYGDTRSNPGTHDYVAEEIVATYLDDPNYQSFILSVGDLVSNGNSESDWDHQFFDPAYSNIQSMLGNLPYQSCMGNHEGSGVLFVKYFPYPYVDRRFWSYDYGPAHFVVIDQYTNYLPGSAQYQWIEDDLASTSKPWKFIYLHEPGWSAGGHENNHTVQNYIQPLCEEFGVSIVFAGHNHYYARAVVNDIHHVTTGGGGAPLYQPNPNYPNIVEAAMANHFCKIEIENSRLYFEVSTPVGAIIDTFSIERVSVNDGNTQIPDVDKLYYSYPNPFNSKTSIRFKLNAPADVKLQTYNLAGQLVENLVREYKNTGEYLINWDASQYPSGIYFCKLTAGDKVFVKRMTLLK